MGSDLAPESKFISLVSRLAFLDPDPDSDFDSDSDSDSDSYWDFESRLISLTIQIISLVNSMDLDLDSESELMLLVSQAIYVFKSMDLDYQPKPFAALILLIKRTIFLFKSLDLYSEPKQLSKLKSLLTQASLDWKFRSQYSLTLDPQPSSYGSFISLVEVILRLETEPELMSLIRKIFFLVVSMNPKWKNLVSLGPQVRVSFEKRKFRVTGKVNRGSKNKWDCIPANWEKFKLSGGEDDTHFHCTGCRGENHGVFEKAPLEIKHLLHPKHSLQLVLFDNIEGSTRGCYCCDEELISVFYYCSACDYAMNIYCVEKQPLLAIDRPKWHEHQLHLFSSQASLTCDICALVHSSCPFYICPPCGFVVHQSCINLPRVIRISRHLHRISFTPSFDQGDWSCSVCRRKIDNDYGGYSCTKEGCSYVAHSKCATQKNVWDGKDLDGEPEEIEEEVLEPFVRISDGVIQYFSHQHHHLRLDEDTSRDYDDNKLCQACILPIYFGNFYSCMKCDYILHETCANLSRKMHHPIHPHLLTLVGGYDGIMDHREDQCSTCHWSCKTGFFYQCGKEECDFKLHVQCATISEPLLHESHQHPLFLTTKPQEYRLCSVCKDPRNSTTNETFNCIDCDFSLCFACATLPQKVRYMHDKHMFTLSYGEETSTIAYWCEACERKINPRKRFYKCDEYCCVVLHIKCLIGKDLYMKPDSLFNYSSYDYDGDKVGILPNKHHMSRPICSDCKMRCPYKIVFQFSGLLFCSLSCTYAAIHFRGRTK